MPIQLSLWTLLAVTGTQNEQSRRGCSSKHDGVCAARCASILILTPPDTDRLGIYWCDMLVKYQ